MIGIANMFTQTVNYFVLRGYGRRKPISAYMLGLSVLMMSLAPLVALRMELAFAKVAVPTAFLVEVAFRTMFVFTVELYPSAVRSAGVCGAFLFGRLGGISASLFSALRFLDPPMDRLIPMLVNAVVFFTLGLLVLSLPETLAMSATDKGQEAAEEDKWRLDSPVKQKSRQVSRKCIVREEGLPTSVNAFKGRQPAARTSGATLQVGLLTQPLPTTSGACFVSIFQGPAYPRVAIPPHPSLQVTSGNQRGQASAAALGTLVSAASTGWQPAARTSGAALQGGLLTQPLPTTSGACFVGIFQGPVYPRVTIPPHPSLQVTSDNQRCQASSAARGTLVSADSTSWQPAARTSGAALQGGLLTQPLPATSGACFVSIFQGPAYPRVAIPPHPSLQVTSDNQRCQASAAALGTLVSAASTGRQPAARTSGAALQGGLLTQPLPTTSGACFVSIFQGSAYPCVAIPPHSSLQMTSDNQRGQGSVAARGTLVSAASTGWQPAARTSGAALQGGLLTQPLPTTSGACFVTSDNQRGQASVAARGT
ncbi:solute carrier family 22 member 21-like [Ixodes scapularis]